MTITHKIKKLEFNIQFDSEKTAFERQAAVTSFVRKRMVKVMEQVFDHHTKPGYIQRFDGITIDLGQIRMDEFPHELEYRLRKKLHDFFKDHGEGPVSGVKLKPADIQSRERDDEDNIIFFLINGFLPWQTTFSDGSDMGKKLEYLLQTRPDRIIDFLKHAGDRKRISKRLARQFPVPVLEKLVRLLSPGEDLPYAEYTKKDKEPALIPGGQSLASDVKTSVIIGSQGEKSRFWEKRIFDNLSGKQISMHPDTGPNLDTSFDSSIAPDRSRVKDSMPERSGKPGRQKAGRAEPEKPSPGQGHEKKRLPHTLKELQAILKKGGHHLGPGDAKQFFVLVQAFADDPNLFEILVSSMRHQDLLQWVETLILSHEMIFKKASFLSGKKQLPAKMLKRVRKTALVSHTPGIFLARVLAYLICNPSKPPDVFDGSRPKDKEAGSKIEWGGVKRTPDPAAAAVLNIAERSTGEPGEDPVITDRRVDKADQHSKVQAGQICDPYPPAMPGRTVPGSRKTDFSVQLKHHPGKHRKKRSFDQQAVNGLFGVIRNVAGSSSRGADLMFRLLRKHDSVWKEMAATAGDNDLNEMQAILKMRGHQLKSGDEKLLQAKTLKQVRKTASADQTPGMFLAQVPAHPIGHPLKAPKEIDGLRPKDNVTGPKLEWQPVGRTPDPAAAVSSGPATTGEPGDDPAITEKVFEKQSSERDRLYNQQAGSSRKTINQAGVHGIAQLLDSWLQDPALIRETARLPARDLRQFLMILCRVHLLNRSSSSSMSGHGRDPVRFIGRVYHALSLSKTGDQKDFLIQVMVCLAENRIAELDKLLEQGRQERMFIPAGSPEVKDKKTPASAGTPGSLSKRSFKKSGFPAEVMPPHLLRPTGKRYRRYHSRDPIFIKNAGIVLAGPFLPTLFKKLDLVETLVSRVGEAVHKAIHTLEYMVNGRLISPEYNLVLNKILCGVDLQVPVKQQVTLEKREKDIVNSLLFSMITHWKALGKTSVKGFQESFLAREGKLSLEDDVWTLVVAPKPFDMLLDRIPWTYLHIRLPWMEQAVHVKWR